MKVVILAGGFGTRLSEYTDSIPKPMIPIGKKPIIEHIMETYSLYGYKEFVVALGYKGKVIKSYFKNLKKNWKIDLVDTGSETLTGGRIKRLENIIKDETFFLTYGDGLCNINIDKLLKFHKKNKKIVTVTAVRPPARFGSLTIKKNKVIEFNEKVIKGDTWINGGYFVMEPKIFKFLKGDNEILEKKPLEKLAKISELYAYKHYGFWACMDHKIDKDRLDEMCRKKKYAMVKKIKKIICFDIDGVICLTKKNNYIKIFTARFMGRSKENINLAKQRGYYFTKKQLDKWNVKYHKLIFGKPSYDLFIDDKTIFYKKNWIKKIDLELNK